MSEEAGFLKAIADQLAERTTRLAYADWLDEHDRPREAEFLRVQVQVAEANARLLDLSGELNADWLARIGNVQIDSQRLELRSGRSVFLREFRQWNFYEGLMAGVPTSEDNRDGLAALVSAERERRNEEPYLVPPTERPVKRPDRDWDTETRGVFPTVACVARLLSFVAARDANRDGSELVVIWFQHEWAFPIDPGVREHIRAIDWNTHAHDFDW